MNLMQQLKQGACPVILDGATGMNLQKAGMPAGVCPEQWTLEHPDVLKTLQRAFVQAGSNAVYAPTFGANRVKLRQYGLEGRTAEMNRALVALSREAVGDGVAVGGDMASLGLFIEPFGDASFADIVEIYREQAQALADAGVDFFVAETLMQLFEARAALLAVRSVSDKPFFASVTLEQNGRMLGGSEPLAALAVMQGMGADAFGINCSNGPAEIARILSELAPYAEIPLLAKPNAGLPETAPDGCAHYHMTPAEFASFAPQFASAGVSLLGGCCGTEPAHIAALAAAAQTPTCQTPAPMILTASEKTAFCFSEMPALSEPINASDDLADAIADCEADEGELVCIRLSDETDVDDLLENVFQLANPICLMASDEALLETALRNYQGRACFVYNGTNPEAAAALSKRYGAVCCCKGE